jgi:hypothetical protein
METTSSKYALYLRVLTDKQRIDGYGIDAQRSTISRYVPGAEFIEVEGGKRRDRPELLRALTGEVLHNLIREAEQTAAKKVKIRREVDERIRQRTTR